MRTHISKRIHCHAKLTRQLIFKSFIVAVFILCTIALIATIHYNDQRLHTTILMSGFVSEYDKWPPNCFLTGDGVHRVIPSQLWVPSPEIPLFPLPEEPADPQSSSPPVIPKVKAWQAYSHSRKPNGTHHKDDLLKRRGSRLSLRYWRDWLGTSHRFHDFVLSHDV